MGEVDLYLAKSSDRHRNRVHILSINKQYEIKYAIVYMSAADWPSQRIFLNEIFNRFCGYFWRHSVLLSGFSALLTVPVRSIVWPLLLLWLLLVDSRPLT